MLTRNVLVRERVEVRRDSRKAGLAVGVSPSGRWGLGSDRGHDLLAVGSVIRAGGSHEFVRRSSRRNRDAGLGYDVRVSVAQQDVRMSGERVWRAGWRAES